MPSISEHLKSGSNRITGALIIVKATLPVLVILFLTIGFWHFASSVNTVVENGYSQIQPHLEDAQVQIDSLYKEGARLVGEVKKIKHASAQAADSVKQYVEPIRQSLVGLSGAMKTIASTIEAILNGIIRVINKAPVIKDIRYVNLPDVRIPGFSLPEINIDLDLRPNLQSVEALNRLLIEVAEESEQSITAINQGFKTWWGSLKLSALLILSWLFLTVVGYAARVRHRFTVGWSMVRGHRVSNALRYL